MLQFARRPAALATILALSIVVGCSPKTSTPPPSQTGPELAGAWYQIYFESDSADIGPRGQMIVKNVAYVVANTTGSRVTVIGKTDRVGAPSANMILSQRRADAVRDSLIAAGVPAARIDTSWTGEARQEVATGNEVAERRNRVVDVTVIKQ